MSGKQFIFAKICALLSNDEFETKKGKVVTTNKTKAQHYFYLLLKTLNYTQYTYLLSVVDPPDRKHDRSVEWSFAIFTTFESNNQVDM